MIYYSSCTVTMSDYNCVFILFQSFISTNETNVTSKGLFYKVYK